MPIRDTALRAWLHFSAAWFSAPLTEAQTGALFTPMRRDCSALPLPMQTLLYREVEIKPWFAQQTEVRHGIMFTPAMQEQTCAAAGSPPPPRAGWLETSAHS